jgi:hypothetical protein
MIEEGTHMTQAVLPPVAKSFHTFCKKCDADRYHTVLTHTSDVSAKIECEVCHSKKTYKLPKEGPVAKKKTATTGTRKVGVRKTSHADQYNALMLNRGAEKGTPFSIKTKFTLDQKIDHGKFGPGFVKTVQLDRIDVMFEDEIKTLMHNKQ